MPLRGATRLLLVAHDGDQLWTGAHENKVFFAAGGGKLAVLGQKAIARIDRVAAGAAGSLDQGAGVEIARRRWRRTDAHAAIGHPDMGRIAVRYGIDRHRLQAEFAAGAHGTEGDLTSIGNEYSFHAGDSRSARCAVWQNKKSSCNTFYSGF